MKYKLITSLLAALGSLTFSMEATAQHLSYSSSSDVYGWLYTNIDSPYIPSGNQFSVQLPSDGQYSNGTTNIHSTSAWSLPAGEVTTDIIYNLATDKGLYAYGYSGEAAVFGNQLKASVATTSTDTSWQNPNGTSVSANSYARFDDQWLIRSNSNHAARSYGAILVTATLDGYFPTAAGSDNNASAYLQAQTSFTDTAGVNYNSYFNLNAYPSGSSVSGGNWTYDDWTVQGNSITVTKKLLFQYDTAFNLNMYLYASSSGNGQADFYNTGKITEILLPFDAELETGSQSSGLEGVTLGNVHHASSLNDPNTTWDFGSADGGGITPNVPEPESYAMFLAGLGLMGLLTRRRSRA